MITLPALIPATSPVAGFTVATAVLLLLQVPPIAPPLLVTVMEEPAHTVVAPPSVPGLAGALTAIVLFALNVPQPLDTV